MNFLIKVLYRINIDIKASIGPGFMPGHFGGVYIGRCRVGRNCNTHQRVRIGELPLYCNKPGPVIGDNVWIGAHSQIYKGVVIEDNVSIASGSVVTNNIKNGCLVMGNPARVRKKNMIIHSF